MENINLCKILKGHEGEAFYCLLFGEVELRRINSESTALIEIIAEDGTLFVLDRYGRFVVNNDKCECVIFPSKDQRDWNKWIEEQKSKVPKTWSELEKQPICDSYILGKSLGEVEFTKKGVTPIEKSALALLKIHQLIEVGYGGNVTFEEWDIQNIKYTICPFHYTTHYFDIITTTYYPDKCHIAFHTMEQAEEFLKYPENVQLLKDYFMI